jgi:hypothetical protein
MKKISLITIFDNINFGTYLQAFALGQILKIKGFDVEIVNYIRSSETLPKIMKKNLSKNIIKIFYRFFYIIPQTVLMRKKNILFIKKFLRISKKYTSFEFLKNAPPKADVYLTGSDQVWNSWHNEGVDRSYYLDFAPVGKDRIAYGASIGMNDFQENEKRIIKEMLDKYKFISVREKKAKEVLKNLKIENVEVVLDPTLLFSKDEWLKLVDISIFKKKEPYLLIYSVEGKSENNHIKDVADQVSKNKELSVYSVSSNGKIRDFINFTDRDFICASLPLFLSLFAQADFVVVSSFHGTAFSINMNKNFITISPSKFNTRIDNLLNICNLQERKISGINSYTNKLLDDIDYSGVNRILSCERTDSIHFLEKALH